MADHEPPATGNGVMSFVVLLALAAATVGVVFTSLLPARENLHRTRVAIARQQQRNEALDVQIGDLREEIRLHETDAWTNLRIQRDEHGLSEPDEIKVK